MSIQRSWVEKLFVNMGMLYGNRMDRVWSGMDKEQVIGFWHSKLSVLGQDEFIRGVKALDSIEFPPTLPQFLALCRPPVDAFKAYHEAVRGLNERRGGRKGEWSHPAIFWASASMAHDLLHMSHQQIKARFEAKLEDELAKTTWPEIPDVAEMLPSPEVDREKGREQAEAMLAQVNAAGVVKQTANGNGQWIHSNFERMTRERDPWKPLPAVRSCILSGARALGMPIPEGV